MDHLEFNRHCQTIVCFMVGYMHRVDEETLLVEYAEAGKKLFQLMQESGIWEDMRKGD